MYGQASNAAGYGVYAYNSNSSGYALYSSGKAHITGSLEVESSQASKSGGGSWNTYSDARLKNVLGDYKLGLNQILSLNPVRYEYKKGNALNIPSGQQFIGLIAQDVEKVIPEAVSKGTNDYLSLNADPIIWAMLNAIKEQQNEIKALQTKYDALESRLKAIEEKMGK